MWLTFSPPQEGPLRPAGDFGALVALNEVRLAPGGAFAPPAREEAEIVTYVYRGALAQEDSTGSSGVVQAGELQSMITGRGIRHKETNASRSEWAHIFRISLVPSQVGLGCGSEQKRFAAAQRRNVLCVVASPDGRKGSLRLLQDTIICSSVLDSGYHLVHELFPGRVAWLHIIRGEVTMHDVILNPGDGAGTVLEPSVSLTARENTEILLVDLYRAPRTSPAGGSLAGPTGEVALPPGSTACSMATRPRPPTSLPPLLTKPAPDGRRPRTASCPRQAHDNEAPRRRA